MVLVAVAVTCCPTATAVLEEKLKEALPDPSVKTVLEPMNVWPWLPEGLEKNCMVYCSRGRLLRVPSMVVVPEMVVAEENTGKF